MNTPKAALSGNLLRVGAGVLGLAAVSVLLVQGSQAAFTASTASEGNVVDSGTVVLANDGATTAMFNVGNLNGGQTVERCINVEYTGTLTADIRLHGVSSGALAPGLTTNIEVGSGATGGTAFDCTDFTPAGTAAFNGTLAAFGTSHGSYSSGIAGYSDATAGAEKSYKITMTVSNDKAFQGKSAAMDFTWEAQGQDVATTNR